MQIKMMSICRFRWAIIDTATTISYWYHYLHTSCVSNRIWIFCWFPSSMHYSSTMIGIFKFCPNKIRGLFSSKISKMWFKIPIKVTYWLKMVTSSVWVKCYNTWIKFSVIWKGSRWQTWPIISGHKFEILVIVSSYKGSSPARAQRPAPSPVGTCGKTPKTRNSLNLNGFSATLNLIYSNFLPYKIKFRL